MLDLAQFQRQSFDVTLPDGTAVQLEPPKIKTLRQLEDMMKSGGASVDMVADMLLLILNKNRAKKKFTKKQIDEQFETDIAAVLIGRYFDWVRGVKNDPN